MASSIQSVDTGMDLRNLLLDPRFSQAREEKDSHSYAMQASRDLEELSRLVKRLLSLPFNREP